MPSTIYSRFIVYVFYDCGRLYVLLTGCYVCVVGWVCLSVFFLFFISIYIFAYTFINILSYEKSCQFIISFPIGTQNNNRNFIVKLFSSRCNDKNRHCLYGIYYFDGNGAQLSTLYLVKGH